MSCDVGEVTESLENELYLRQNSSSNPSVASPTSQDFHLRYLASRPCGGKTKLEDRLSRRLKS